MSILGPLENLRPFFVVLFSLLLLQEQPTIFLFLGIIFIVIGTMVLNVKKRFWSLSQFQQYGKETFFIIASTALFGLESIFDKKALRYIDPSKYAFFILLGMCLGFGVFYISHKKTYERKHLFSWYLIAIGIFFAIGYFGIITAVSLASPNLVTPVQMIRSLYLSLLGFVFLREKNYVRKITAAVLMLIGVFLIVR